MIKMNKENYTEKNITRQNQQQNQPHTDIQTRENWKIKFRYIESREKKNKNKNTKCFSFFICSNVTVD